jgi:TRAP-type mannitol/chloroaromatic compound transport system permease large subunit
LSTRLVNLFENDLLQALPLYVTMGLLLDRLPVADALYRTANAILPRKPSAPLVSGMLLGALLGPMNGSVGASVLVSRAWSRRGLPPKASRRRTGTHWWRWRARSACWCRRRWC